MKTHLSTLCRITKDTDNIYGVGAEINAERIFEDYCSKCDTGIGLWLCRIPFSDAVEYCAKALKVEYRYI